MMYPISTQIDFINGKFTINKMTSQNNATELFNKIKLAIYVWETLSPQNEHERPNLERYIGLLILDLFNLDKDLGCKLMCSTSLEIIDALEKRARSDIQMNSG